MHTVASRNWATTARNHAPGFCVEDHRRLGWGTTLRDSKAFVEAHKTLFELADDVRYRLDHFRASERVILCQGAWVGTRQGGAFEIPFCHVAELDLTPRFQRVDSYDLGTGYGHVALTTSDLDATLAALAGKGIEPERPPYAVREGGARICFVRDPDS